MSEQANAGQSAEIAASNAAIQSNSLPSNGQANPDDLQKQIDGTELSESKIPQSPDASYFQEMPESNNKSTAVATTAPSAGQNKRSHDEANSAQNADADTAGDDLQLHVDVSWSDDEKDEKENPAKRVATTVESRENEPVAVKKSTSGPLENFAIRVVITRKDVAVVFEKDSSITKDSIEEQTKTSITIITGKDDPDIVVDRVLVVKGHIDNVALVYYLVTQAMLEAKEGDKSAKAEKDNKAAGAPEDSKNEDKVVEKAESSDAAGAETTVDDTADSTTADNATAKEASGPKIVLRMLVPHKCVGGIMGHAGKTINNIRESSGVNIHTSESTLPRSSERIVELVGSPESIQKALRLIAEALTKDIGAYNNTNHYVPAANLPSAMTVDTQSRKRKDNKRHSHIGDNRNNNNNNNNNHVHNNRNNNYRNAGGHANQNNNNNNNANTNNNNTNSNGNQRGFNRNNFRDRNRNDRYHNRYERHDRYERPGPRGRAPTNMSDVNRTPVRSAPMHSPFNNRGPRPGGNHNNNNNNNNNNGGYGGGGGGYGMRNTNNYSGYNARPMNNTGAASSPMPINPNVNGHNPRYGPGMQVVPPVSTGNSYGATTYNTAPGSYQFPAPTNYGYTPAATPVQPMYTPAAAQSTGNSYQPRPYGNARGPRPQQMSQPSVIPQTTPSRVHNTAGVGAGAGGGPATGETIQQIYVPSEKVGAVIGRRGETINEIRRTTNARIDIQDSAQGAQQRLVIITGGYEQVRAAYYMIKNKVDMARPAPMRP